VNFTATGELVLKLTGGLEPTAKDIEGLRTEYYSNFYAFSFNIFFGDPLWEIEGELEYWLVL
jgi:hypothetical protein